MKSFGVDVMQHHLDNFRQFGDTLNTAMPYLMNPKKLLDEIMEKEREKERIINELLGPSRGSGAEGYE